MANYLHSHRARTIDIQIVMVFIKGIEVVTQIFDFLSGVIPKTDGKSNASFFETIDRGDIITVTSN